MAKAAVSTVPRLPSPKLLFPVPFYSDHAHATGASGETRDDYDSAVTSQRLWMVSDQPITHTNSQTGATRYRGLRALRL